MKKQFMVSVAFLLIALLAGFDAEARRSRRCCHGGAAAAGFFAGAFTGAALAGAYDRAYYVDMPTYEMVYPGAPILAYDYPTYVYTPVYAYPDTLYTYPGYYFAY